jgi:chromosome transmission fidelity protein 18
VIRKATTGMKEADASIMSVLNDLFTPLSKRRVKELALTEEEQGQYTSRLSREVDSCGKDSALAVGKLILLCSSLESSPSTFLIGCFAHYATLRQHDVNFSRYEKANEWLMTFDALSASMYTGGDFALAQYLPYTLVSFFPLFNERGGPKVERNSADWDVRATYSF